MSFLKDIQRTSYKISRAAGDVSAAQRGTLPRRVARRKVTRTAGRSWDRLWR